MFDNIMNLNIMVLLFINLLKLINNFAVSYSVSKFCTLIFMFDIVSNFIALLAQNSFIN